MKENNLGFHLRYPFSGNFDDYSGFQPKVTPQKNFSRQCSRQNGYRTVTELIQKGHSSVKEWSHNGHKMVTERSKTVTGQSQDRHKTVTEHRMVTEGSEKGHRMAAIQNNFLTITESRKEKESFGPSGKQAR